jgi:hypothetical protein
MKISTIGSGHFRSKAGKIIMGLVFASMVGGLTAGPALGRDDYRRPGPYDHGRYERRGHDRDYHYYERGRRVYRPYGYRAPVYAPPPVIYAPPPPPPGISIFLPPIVIR